MEPTPVVNSRDCKAHNQGHSLMAFQLANANAMAGLGSFEMEDGSGSGNANMVALDYL